MPSAARFDVLGIGNAIVDVTAPVAEPFLQRHAMVKGAMNLIDAMAAERIYGDMPPATESSGGSAANTCAVAAALGARSAFLGLVADDALGLVFRHDIAAAGVHFPTPPLTGGAPTARSFILVTADGQRTMNTFLGACVSFGPADLDEDVIAAASVSYLEGYLFDPPAAQAAFRRAAAVAHAAGRQVALTLSDPFCVDRHRAAFRALVAGEVDLLFANQAEICSLYETDDFEAAAAHARREVAVVALTRGVEGSVLLRGEERVTVAAVPTNLVDSTGAGDAYAAGFLAGYTAGRPLAACGRLGSVAGAEVISHFGARPLRSLADELARAV